MVASRALLLWKEEAASVAAGPGRRHTGQLRVECATRRVRSSSSSARNAASSKSWATRESAHPIKQRRQKVWLHGPKATGCSSSLKQMGQASASATAGSMPDIDGHVP
eukprot:CAMPEP_0115855538 /NCGR_PEP_ID=MMETSP0287-20121206/14592_1 /TAXON_ID=412157 /ORGANISM="Chrysochromulina rotalis, Strain UIO044" /LENGTH=107 /DNA_ID=CAMNT_0003309691 /DNA_START=992 /DNA_END=1311 /DNA_ORIENTATION=-